MPHVPAPPPGADADLVEAFRRGDEFAFATLYDQHKGAVYGYAAKMLLSRSAAEDVVQETFARAYEHRERLVSAAAFRSWIFTIARNQCLNALARAEREPPIKENADPRPAPGTPFSHTSFQSDNRAPTGEIARDAKKCSRFSSPGLFVGSLGGLQLV